MFLIGISVTSALAVTFVHPDAITADVVGNAIITAKSTGGNAVIKMADAGTAAYAFTVFDNTQRFDITDITQGKVRLSVISNGNVGIGTITPTQTLTVKGDIGLSGNIISTTGDLCIGTCP